MFNYSDSDLLVKKFLNIFKGIENLEIFKRIIDIVGESFIINGKKFTITGVMDILHGEFFPNESIRAKLRIEDEECNVFCSTVDDKGYIGDLLQFNPPPTGISAYDGSIGRFLTKEDLFSQI